MKLPGMRLFARSRSRDFENDTKRREAVLAQIQKEKLSIVAEIDGLSRRLSEEYERQAILLDSSEEYDSRAVEDEHLLVDAERVSRQVASRLETLNAELAVFSRLEGLALSGDQAGAA
jgi:hypothetical protein